MVDRLVPRSIDDQPELVVHDSTADLNTNGRGIETRRRAQARHGKPSVAPVTDRTAGEPGRTASLGDGHDAGVDKARTQARSPTLVE